MPATHAESGQNNSVHIRRGWYLSRTTTAGNDVVKCRRKTALFMNEREGKLNSHLPLFDLIPQMSELLKVESTCPIHLKHEQLRPKPSDASASVSTHKTTCFLFQRRRLKTNISFPTKWALFYASKRLSSCGPREDLACRLIISKSTWFITAFVRT